MYMQIQREQVSTKTLPMPDQVLRYPFIDDRAPGLNQRRIPKLQRLLLFGVPLAFSLIVSTVLAIAFLGDGQLSWSEMLLISLMALLSGWQAIASATAIIGLMAAQNSKSMVSERSLVVAILATIRDENANEVLAGKLNLLRLLQLHPHHSFEMYVLSDSASSANIENERRIVRAAAPLPVFHHHRHVNVDFKSGNIRNWISGYGADYDAFIVLDSDSELNSETALVLANALAADPACGLIQTTPLVLPGITRWQRMQSHASQCYGALQGAGLSEWMGDEANYYGHNAIVRASAFAACAGLPHVQGRGLWNGVILSHDFVEAALLRRAGWAVRIMPSASGSSEQTPADIMAHLKRDARWCLGNFQHSRILGAGGLHPVSRFHFVSGMLTYLSSALWLATLALWAVLDSTKTGVGGKLTVFILALIAINLLLPRALGILHATRRKPSHFWAFVKIAVVETLFSSLFAPSLMLQRVKILTQVMANRTLSWAPFERPNRSFVDYCLFHSIEVLSGLCLLACIERATLTPWFLPLAACLVFTPLFSWFSAQPILVDAHEKLNDSTAF